MPEEITQWCAERIALARNHLQILQLGHRCRVGDQDVTEQIVEQMQRDINGLLAIMLACEAIRTADRT